MRCGFRHGPRNDQWRARFVDQDAIYLVNNCKIVLALYQVFGTNRHVIVEVIKTKLIFCAVHDIHKTGVFVVAWTHAIPIFPLFFHNKTFHAQRSVLNDAYGEAQEQIHGSQPHGVALGEVGVYGDEMHAAPEQAI